MSLIQIAWRNFCHRSLSSILTTLSLALGVGLVVLVLSLTISMPSIESTRVPRVSPARSAGEPGSVYTTATSRGGKLATSQYSFRQQT